MAYHNVIIVMVNVHTFGAHVYEVCTYTVHKVYILILKGMIKVQ